jgi:hypothetical protein
VEERKSPHPELPRHRPACAVSLSDCLRGQILRRGGLGAAESALAADIYQAFFYRGLARLPAIKKKAGWDYDYACVLAYDGTEDGALSRAWNGLRPKIGRGCWEGAGIYVMILPG